MEYKISVIIPVYNAARFLKEAMDSLIGQTIGFENLQVIMVDDCSTDESPKIMDEYAKQYSNVEVYRTEVNSGADGGPRSLGMDYAKAPYMMFLDADDCYEPDACRTLYEKIVETGVEIVGGYHCTVEMNGRNMVRCCPCEDERRFYFPEEMIEFFKISGGFWDRIYDAGFIERNHLRFSPDGYGQDTAFTCKCLRVAESYIYIPTLVLFYRQNDASLTHVLSESYFAKCIPSTTEIRETLAPWPAVQSWKLGSLAAYYYEKSIQAHNLGKQELVHIYHTYKELFAELCEEIAINIRCGLTLICEGNTELAAEYTLVVREFEHRLQRDQEAIRNYEEYIRRHESRMISRLADAVNQRRFGDAIKICFAAIKPRLRK